MAIVVVVAYGSAEAPSAMMNARLRRNVGEGAIVIVVIELAGMTPACFHVLERGSVHEENVHPAIIVVVKDGNAAAHRFHDVALARIAAGKLKINSCRARYIGERNRGRNFLLRARWRNRNMFAG